jgi:hypothetical protein
MIANERLWRTSDNRLVRDGDVAAELLAYTPGDTVKPADESLVPGDPEAKAEAKPQDKAVDKPEDKGLTGRRTK